jgi:hypothetical protein
MMRAASSALFLILAACATQPAVVESPAPTSQPIVRDQPASDYPPACSVEFPPNPNIAAWSTDKFAGSYASGTLRLTVRRAGNHMLVERAGAAATQINSDSAESWAFADGCGTRYLFMLPPDGPGAWLTITTAAGVKSDWHRSGY